jgi:hypothetical protein
MEGLLGKLRIRIWVLPLAENYGYNLLQIDQLQKYLQNRQKETWSTINEQYQRKGQEDLVVVLPQEYERLTIHGRQWLRFKFGGQFDFYGYAIALREDRILQVEFDFVDNTYGQKQDAWRPDAERLREEIAATLRLERRPGEKKGD